MNTRIPSILVAASLTAALLTSSGCGGGGDSDWLFPLWVPTDVWVEDVDGDTRADILTLASYSTGMDQQEGRLVVRRQTTPGVFASAQTYSFGTSPWKMAVGDIDGDGAVDLVVTDVGRTNRPDPAAIWMLLQDAATPGVFLTPRRLPLEPGYPLDLAIGDINGDGLPDLVLADGLGTPSAATLLVQDPANPATFLAPTTIPLPGKPGALALGDVNGDGRNDLVFRVRTSMVNYVATTKLVIIHQQSSGILEPALMLSPQTGLIQAMLTLVDYNVDGLTDVVEFFTPSSVEYTSKVTALLQDAPPGTFTAVDTPLGQVKGIDDGVVADLDGDGRPDFATVGFYPVGAPTTVRSTLNVFIQDSMGGFVQTAAMAMPSSCSRLAAGDINGDGLEDLVALCSENRIVLVLQSTSIPGTFLPPQMID